MIQGEENHAGPAPGSEQERLQTWLGSPEKLLHLVAGSAATAGPVHRETVEVRLREEDVVTLVRLLAHVTLVSRQVKSEEEAGVLSDFFRQRLQGLPVDMVVAMERTLGQLAVAGRPNLPLPVQLAAGLTLRLAAEAYQRGEVSPSGIHVLLDRMSSELGTLRRALGLPMVEDYTNELEQNFWGALPEPERRRVLASSDAWCVPPATLRQAVEELREQPETARQLLENYAGCAHHASEFARWRAAQGMNELADLYAPFGEELLASVIGHAGRQLAREPKLEIQSLLNAAFARLSALAANQRGYRALRQSLDWVNSIERGEPSRAEKLRSRVGVESHLREFVREALEAPAVPRDLVGLLQQAPVEAAELLSEEFESHRRRADRNRLVEIASAVGPAAVSHLREKLRGDPSSAVRVVGLLSRLDAGALVEQLPRLLGRWTRDCHDALVHGLAAGDAPQRGRILVRLLESLHPLVLPVALDEIGLSGEPEAAPRLVRLAGGTLPQSSEPYLRVKALEALGRLRDPVAAPLLRLLVESAGVWRWKEPREIRIAAAQALAKIDPDWARRFLRSSGLNAAELAVAPLDAEPAALYVRQRRYPRVPLAAKVPTVASTMRGQWSLATSVLSLGGGLAESQAPLAAGTEVELQLQTGLRPVRATALVRDPRPSVLGFEIVAINLDERSKLRRLLASQPA